MNLNPTIKDDNNVRFKLEINNGILTNINKETVFELIRDIKDPEHPYTLEKLGVVTLDRVKVYKIDQDNVNLYLAEEFQEKGDLEANDCGKNLDLNRDECSIETDLQLSGDLYKVGLPISVIDIEFVPTIPNCSMASLIGISLRIHLERFIKGYWIRINIKKKTHVDYKSINRQVNDKDRVFAAMENEKLMMVIEDCLELAKYSIERNKIKENN
ncbi:MIP18 family protein F45G2.10 [Dictyocoela muelleri]|nr:MIP18 family protein F45G2.10 [Dictyocoela muelleri]